MNRARRSSLFVSAGMTALPALPAMVVIATLTALAANCAGAPASARSGAPDSSGAPVLGSAALSAPDDSGPVAAAQPPAATAAGPSETAGASSASETTAAAGDAGAAGASQASRGSGASGASGGGAAAALPPDAESLARDYRRTGEPAAIERDRAALVPYGHGHPALRCAPLRACALELEAGELVLSTSSGDSERWIVQVVATGPGARTPLVVVKPTACDLSTNLLVSTDRRLYEVGLESPPCRGADSGADSGSGSGAGAGRSNGSYNPQLSYTGITRFYYPDDLVRRWVREEEAARAAAVERSAGTLPLAAAPLTSLNFAYTWERDRRFPWAPAQVFDDGRRTFIVLPPGARSAEAPALFLVLPGGGLALLNYRLENGTYVADRILDHAVLTVAAGRAKSPYRLEIVNHSRGAR